MKTTMTINGIDYSTMDYSQWQVSRETMRILAMNEKLSFAESRGGKISSEFLPLVIEYLLNCVEMRAGAMFNREKTLEKIMAKINN